MALTIREGRKEGRTLDAGRHPPNSNSILTRKQKPPGSRNPGEPLGSSFPSKLKNEKNQISPRQVGPLALFSVMAEDCWLRAGCGGGRPTRREISSPFPSHPHLVTGERTGE